MFVIVLNDNNRFIHCDKKTKWNVGKSVWNGNTEIREPEQNVFFSFRFDSDFYSNP